MTIDPALAAFLADPRNTVRRPPPHVPIEKVRQVANAAMIGDPGPALHAVEDVAVDLDDRSLRLRLYRPTTAPLLPLILFVHGGGWVWGNLDTHDAICRRFSLASGAAVIAVDYRLSPETNRAGQIDDVFVALEWAHNEADRLGLDGARVALCGDSAGAALALAAALRAGDEGLPLAHLAMIYPALDPACDSASQTHFAEGYMLTREAMRWFWECHFGTDARDPRSSASAIAPDRLRTLPPVTLAVAEFDILRDEGEAFAQRLAEAGAVMQLRRYDGMIHGFLSLPATTATAVRAIDEIATDIERSLRLQSE
jgi:acetyl esterase